MTDKFSVFLTNCERWGVNNFYFVAVVVEFKPFRDQDDSGLGRFVTRYFKYSILFIL